MRAPVLVALGGLVVLAVGGCGAARSPLDRIAADRTFLERDIRAYAEQLVAEANAEAARLDGQVRVDMHDEHLVMFFVPVPKPEPEPVEPPAKVKGEPDRVEYQAQTVVKTKRRTPRTRPPAAAVRRDWTDRYALAQAFRYRWSVGDIRSIRLIFDDKVPCEATVTFCMHTWRTVGSASDVKPLPQAPEGMRVWTPYGGFGTGWGWGGGDGLPAFAMPGLPVDETAEEPLAQAALQRLAEAEELKHSATLTSRVFYDNVTGRWKIEHQYACELPGPACAADRVRPRKGALQAHRYPDTPKGKDATN